MPRGRSPRGILNLVDKTRLLSNMVIMNPVTDRGRIKGNMLSRSIVKNIKNLIYGKTSGDCDLSVTG